MTVTLSLPARIVNAMQLVDKRCADLTVEMPSLQEMRNYEGLLTSLYAELANEVKNSKRSQLSTYIERRRKQAELFQSARKHLGMTAKDAEEESKLFDPKLTESETEADANWEYLHTLRMALKLKIEFTQNVANDAKWIERSFTPNS